MTNRKTMLDQCLIDKGQGDRCVICPLRKSNQCAQVMDKMKRLLAGLRTKDCRLDELDREEIIHETLYGVIAKVEKALQEEWDITDITRLAGGVFRNKRADFYGKLARFGETTTIELTFIPEGLLPLIECYPNSLSLESKRLSTGPGLSKSLYKKLQRLSSEQSWQQSLEKLYRNSWKGQLVSLDDHAYNLAGHSPDPADKQEEDHVRTSLSPYLFLWQKIGSHQAGSCKDLFVKFGELIFDESDSSRQEIADALQIKTNSLNQRIARCYKLIHKYLIQKLEKMHGDDSFYCRELFIKLYVETTGGKSGILQRITCVAEEKGVTVAEINAGIRRCRKMVMQQIAN